MTKTPKQWRKEMKDNPCYNPAYPFYDVCLNTNKNIKRFNCVKCMTEHKLKDYIE